jgi:hypothetical protein
MNMKPWTIEDAPVGAVIRFRGEGGVSLISAVEPDENHSFHIFIDGALLGDDVGDHAAVAAEHYEWKWPWEPASKWRPCGGPTTAEDPTAVGKLSALVTHLQCDIANREATILRLRDELERERWEHAACLTLAENLAPRPAEAATDKLPKKHSLAMRAVWNLRRQYESCRARVRKYDMLTRGRMTYDAKAKKGTK